MSDKKKRIEIFINGDLIGTCKEHIFNTEYKQKTKGAPRLLDTPIVTREYVELNGFKGVKK